uniref:Uncharacterized protein n=1 Tax=Oryza glumipatula TaxID=40148 RepID=A0A0D9ZA49_9ORYZ
MTAALQALLDPTALSLGLPTPVINKEEYLTICLTVLAGTRAGKALVGKAVLGACGQCVRTGPPISRDPLGSKLQHYFDYVFASSHNCAVRNLESPPTVELANRQSQRTRGVNDALPLSLVRSCRLTPSPPDTCRAPDLILSGPPCWWEWETSRRCSHVGLQAVVPEVASGGAHGAAVDWRPPSATLSADLLPSSPPPARAAPPMLTCATSSPASLPRTPPPVSAPTRHHRRGADNAATADDNEDGLLRRGERGGKERKGEAGLLSWHPEMWGPRGSLTDSAATSDKSGVKTTDGSSLHWFL